MFGRKSYKKVYTDGAKTGIILGFGIAVFVMTALQNLLLAFFASGVLVLLGLVKHKTDQKKMAKEGL